ncbi:PREDICTED: CGG triplet repeat-binding protein 1-like [Crocodylus porosus]|uniref:CGG triplet repeat-binding protein 1-like n=1 Tax=Crocodylus porosus TaxID=8502 RepID=UPI00093EFD14|nr:PREDICTED: CGG triplet repeat-binding protein 1-like [Crocodylus porosus]
MMHEKKFKTAKYISALDHVQQFPVGTLHADGGKLFCSSCSVTLGVSRKNSIDRHLASESQIKQKAAEEAEGQSKKQVTMSSIFKRTNESSVTRREATFALVEAFMDTNTPLEKIGYPK